MLLAVDGEEALSPARLEACSRARRRRASAPDATRCCARTSAARWTSRCSRCPRGNVSAFYYLSLAGFFSLVVGTVVLLRRPADRDVAALLRGLRAVLPASTRSRTPGSSTRFDWLLLLGRLARRRCSCRWCSSTSASPSPSGARARRAAVARPRALHAGARRRPAPRAMSHALFAARRGRPGRCGASSRRSTAPSRSTSRPSSRSPSRCSLDSYRRTRGLDRARGR